MAETIRRKSSTKEKKPFRLTLKQSLFLMAAVAGITVLTLLIIFLPGIMYSQNPRLIFRNLEIDSTGYWQKQPRLLLERIGLEYGVNMFTLDPENIRRKLEENIPSIESAEVSLVLPDTIKIRINERIPRAALYSANSAIVVDRTGKKMKRIESSAVVQRLPVIKAIKDDAQLKSALKLIMSALSNYPQIAIQEISLANPDELLVTLYYREQKRCVVRFPASADMDYDFLLSKLQTVILTYGSDWRIFDLRFRGVVTGR